MWRTDNSEILVKITPEDDKKKILLRKQIMKKSCAYFRNEVEFHGAVQTFYGEHYFW